ncbi:MAG: extracellular solute-binding protein, partial [Lachnospiraceae bacterium]
NIKVESESVDGVKQTVLTNIAAAADVYYFASDQFYDLYSSGALLKLDDVESVIDECGGDDAAIIKNVSIDGDLYAYPMTNSNGYFIYYNKDYFRESDVDNLNNMLDIAASVGKYVAMDWNSGWYLYSFFAGAGKTVQMNSSRSRNVCDFDSQEGQFTGVDVADAMLDIATSKGFKAVLSSEFIDEVRNGSVVALVSGAWNATAIKEIWGDSMAAAKLPTYNIADTSVQMRSFAGFKYMGVNPQSKHPEWACQLAKYLTDKSQQEIRFRTTGECPANEEAAASDEVKASIAITALVEQAPFADVQDVGKNYWTPMSKLGAYLASGNPDNIDLQKLLDDTVKEIEK